MLSWAHGDPSYQSLTIHVVVPDNINDNFVQGIRPCKAYSLVFWPFFKEKNEVLRHLTFTFPLSKHRNRGSFLQYPKPPKGEVGDFLFLYMDLPLKWAMRHS